MWHCQPQAAASSSLSGPELTWHVLGMKHLIFRKKKKKDNHCQILCSFCVESHFLFLARSYESLYLEDAERPTTGLLCRISYERAFVC